MKQILARQAFSVCLRQIQNRKARAMELRHLNGIEVSSCEKASSLLRKETLQSILPKPMRSHSPRFGGRPLVEVGAQSHPKRAKIECKITRLHLMLSHQI